jgi:hypothetical protein
MRIMSEDDHLSADELAEIEAWAEANASDSIRDLSIHAHAVVLYSVDGGSSLAMRDQFSSLTGALDEALTDLLNP